ncbi:MAG TPA: nucleotide exchange factor GrpE [Candidatus Deferrimicrobium sp.]|nr:nucleotide exchange factor GrpE [Candidatus Deferrimicrobium sp.]
MSEVGTGNNQDRRSKTDDARLRKQEPLEAQKALDDSRTEQPESELSEQDAVGSISQPEMTDNVETAAVTDAVAAEPCEEDRLRSRVKELEDQFLRTAADFDNYKKRMARQFEEILQAANDRILIELLDVIDNFERALAHANENTEAKSLRGGVELIANQMTGLLSRYDVTPIEAVGKPFDPNLHEALIQVESEEYPAGAVALEMIRGYRRGSRVIRHSKVGVSTGKKENQQPQQEEQQKI